MSLATNHFFVGTAYERNDKVKIKVTPPTTTDKPTLDIHQGGVSSYISVMEDGKVSDLVTMLRKAADELEATEVKADE